MPSEDNRMSSPLNSGATSAGGQGAGREYTDYDDRSDLGTRTTGTSGAQVSERVVEPHPVQHTEQVTHHETHAVPTAPPTQPSRPVNVAVGAERHDGVRWGPVWAGLLTALTTFLLLELAFYALGWLDLDPGENEPGNSAGLVTGILALVAFFLGGLIAGATALWKGLFSGLLHGFLVWAVGVFAFIALTFFGASALLGSFGDLTSQLGVGPQQVQSSADVSDAEAEQAADTAKDAAAPAFWGLALPLVASMIGGLVGSKIWPRKKDTEPDTVRVG
jgi:hypothetical protein